VREETAEPKNRLKILDLFADERCSQAFLDFLASTDILGGGGGGGAPPRTP